MSSDAHFVKTRDSVWGGPVRGDRDADASLPCLYSNNSIHRTTKGFKGDELGKVYRHIEGEIGEKRLQTYQKKAATTLNRNVKSFMQKHGRDNVGFLTLTYPKDVTTPEEASKRFNSLRTNLLCEVFPDTIAVIEPHKDGRPHLHLLVNAGSDIRGEFDFEAFSQCQDEFQAKGRSQKFWVLQKKYVASAPESLRLLWQLLRENMSKYGFGRSELLPIKENEEALGHYVGKYLNKATAIREDIGWKGVRLTRYTHGSNEHRANFAWVSHGSTLWRSKLATLGKWIGITTDGPTHEIDQLTEALGDRWSWKLRDVIESIVPEVWVYNHAHTCTWHFDSGQMFKLGDETYALAYTYDPETAATTFGLLPSATPRTGTDDFDAAEILHYTPPPDINLPALRAILSHLKRTGNSTDSQVRDRLKVQMRLALDWGN